MLLVSPYATAAFGLAGSLIGGFIAGTVSLVVARQNREAEAQGWLRDNRRDIYERFLAQAQKLLIACENAKRGRSEREAVENAYGDFFEVYGVLQTLAEQPVIVAARVYAYRLVELIKILDSESALGAESFWPAAQLVRRARHDALDAMRRELRVEHTMRPPPGFNPFADTDFEQRWATGDLPAGKSGSYLPP
jgi:hypothetical protein